MTAALLPQCVPADGRAGRAGQAAAQLALMPPRGLLLHTASVISSAEMGSLSSAGARGSSVGCRRAKSLGFNGLATVCSSPFEAQRV